MVTFIHHARSTQCTLNLAVSFSCSAGQEESQPDGSPMLSVPLALLITSSTPPPSVRPDPDVLLHFSCGSPHLLSTAVESEIETPGWWSGEKGEPWLLCHLSEASVAGPDITRFCFISRFLTLTDVCTLCTMRARHVIGSAAVVSLGFRGRRWSVSLDLPSGRKVIVVRFSLSFPRIPYSSSNRACAVSLAPAQWAG
jgi:hypothetical protein